VAIAIATVVAFWFGFKLERRVSEWKLYRVLRGLIRFGTGVAIIPYLLNQQGPAALPGGELFGAILLLPFLLWILVKLDRVTDAAGQEGRDRWDKEPGRLRQFWYDLNGPAAVVMGFGGGVLGFLLGRDMRIITGFVAWAFVIAVILGVKLLLRGIGGLFGMAGSVNLSLGGFPRAFVLGAGVGAASGAVLGKILDGRVQIEAVIIGAVLGVIINLIRRTISGRQVGAPLWRSG